MFPANFFVKYYVTIDRFIATIYIYIYIYIYILQVVTSMYCCNTLNAVYTSLSYAYTNELPCY